MSSLNWFLHPPQIDVALAALLAVWMVLEVAGRKLRPIGRATEVLFALGFYYTVLVG